MKDLGFYNISDEEYHADDAVSKSDLTLFHQSPAHYKAKDLKKKTVPLVIGAAFHAAVLQPEIYAEKYISMPEGVKGTTKAGIAIKEEAAIKDQTVLSWADSGIIADMRKAINAHETASKLLSFSGHSEISGFWVDERTGLACKLRADRIDSDNRIIIDLKTTVDARLEPFTRQLASLKYHWQGYWYLNGVSKITGIDHNDFVIIAIEKEPPYAIAVYRLDDAMIYLGNEEIKILLEEFRQCKEADEWPAYPIAMHNIAMPEWYMKRANL